MALFAVMLAVALALAGCPNVDSCSVVEVDDRIEVTITGSPEGSVQNFINYEPVPSCGNIDTPAAKAVLKIVEGTKVGGCEVPGCPADYPSPSTGFRETAFPGTGSEYVCARTDRKVKVGECEALRKVVLRQSGDDPFGAGPVVLIRRLSYGPKLTGLTCADPLSIFSKDAAQDDDYYECSDAWTVRLERK